MIDLPIFVNLINDFNEKNDNLSEDRNPSKPLLLELMTLGEKLFLNRKYFSHLLTKNEYPQFSINKFLKLVLNIYEQTKDHEKLDYLFRALNLLSTKQFFENFNIFENIKITLQFVDNLTIIFKSMLERYSIDFSSKLILESFSILIRLRNYSTSIIIDIAKIIIHLLSKHLKINFSNPFQFIDFLQKDPHYFDAMVNDCAFSEILTCEDQKIDEKYNIDSLNKNSYQITQSRILSKLVEAEYLAFPVKRLLPKDQLNNDFYNNLISDNEDSVLSDSVDEDNLLGKDKVFDIPDQIIPNLLSDINETDKRKDFIFDLLPITGQEEIKSHVKIQNSIDSPVDFSILGVNRENVEPSIKKNFRNQKKIVSKHKKRYYDELSKKL